MHKYSTSKSSIKHAVKTAVVGARGYSGVELVKLLLKHPQSELVACYATQKFNLADYIYDSTSTNIACHSENEIDPQIADVWFLATPAEASLKLAPLLYAQKKTVIDLSGAFRLKTSSYEKWYNFTHDNKNLLSQASYGLSPFLKPDQNKLVANPGCYATAILMALVPLLNEKLISPKNIVVDAKSGTTGAGRKASENLIFSEVTGDFLPYRLGRHQHLPEIYEAAKDFTGQDIDLQMTTHLLPIDRGISAAIYAQLNETAIDISAIEGAYKKTFADYPLVRVQKGEGALLKLKNVVQTPFTHIVYELINDKLYVFSMIDNLLKGAASQAIENFNRLADLPLTTGLLQGE